jgi:uncharacterized caspase-like protein/tetratricopeptide (TPR) repeat protein
VANAPVSPAGRSNSKCYLIALVLRVWLWRTNSYSAASYDVLFLTTPVTKVIIPEATYAAMCSTIGSQIWLTGFEGEGEAINGRQPILFDGSNKTCEVPEGSKGGAMMFRTLLALFLIWFSFLPGSGARAQNAAPSAGQWALLIGVNDYPGEIQDLRFARDDARALKDLLVSSAGFKAERVRLLTDDSVGAERATKQNILAALSGLATTVQPNDQIIVFLAGHGIVRGIGPDAKSYFLPVDVNAQDSTTLEQTGLDMEELGRRLSALPASQFTIFVDACREDPFPGRGLKGNTMTDVMARGLRIVKRSTTTVSNARVEAPTSVIFYACRIGERAYENPQLGHGVFTYYILRGLKELAARPDGRVEAGLLAGYLRDNVRKWALEMASTTKLPAEQTPTMVATEVRGPVLIARVLPVAGGAPTSKSPGAVTLQTSPEGAVLTLNGQTAGSGPIFKELPPGQYTARAVQAGFQPLETKFTVLPGYHQEVVLTLQPMAANGSYDKGVAFESQRLWPQAIASYEQALREDPNALASYERLANVYTKNNRESEAITLLTAALQKFPNNATLLAHRSRARSALLTPDVKPNEVVPAVAPVVAPEPNNKKGKDAEETEPTSKSEKKGGKKSGKKSKADTQTADLSEFGFAEPQKKSKQDEAEGKAESKSGKKKKQKDEEVVEQPVQKTAAPVNTSRSVGPLNAASAVLEAVRDAEQAVQAEPNLPAAQVALGFAYLLDPQTLSKALDAFVRASTLAPDDAEAYYGIGYVYRLQQQFQQAIPQLKKAVELRPEYYEAQRELAYCYHGQGDTDQAIRQYQLASGHRGKTKSADEVAANNLALASLYKKKGEQVGGKEGEEYKKASQAYEVEANHYSPSLKGASKVLVGAGVSKLVERALPEVFSKFLGGTNKGGGSNNSGNNNQGGIQPKLPGGVKVPIPVKVPGKIKLSDKVEIPLKTELPGKIKLPTKKESSPKVETPVKPSKSTKQTESSKKDSPIKIAVPIKKGSSKVESSSKRVEPSKKEDSSQKESSSGKVEVIKKESLIKKLPLR